MMDLGIVEVAEPVPHLCRCGTVVPSVQIRSYKRGNGERMTWVHWEPEPHLGPCGQRCARGWDDWELGEAVHRDAEDDGPAICPVCAKRAAA